MQFLEFLQENIVLLDGGFGTLLQDRGLAVGEDPATWNLSHPGEVVAVHKAYFDAGCNVVCTNTFGANALHFKDENELEKIIRAGVRNAKLARERSVGEQEKFIALDIGPSGKLLKPLGDLDFEDAVSLFKKTVEIGVQEGVDLIVVETMNDAYETKSAIVAVKESCDLPILCTNAYGEDGKLMTGASPSAMVALLEGLGVDALGVNCSLGPKALKPVVEELLAVASVPVVVKPNAGIPKTVDGKTVFDVGVEEFVKEMRGLVQKGVRVVGGCCGTTPDYLDALAKAMKTEKAQPILQKNRTVVSSYTHAVVFDKKPILIGERINPTGKKRLKQALLEGDVEYLLTEAVGQEEKGVDVLDVNVGLPQLDEEKVLTETVLEVQAVTDLPLQIDTSTPSALESALRRYNGKAMINSVNGKKESMETVFPLAKKYGGLLVALTLDENGIPENAEGRVEIAKKIIATAKQYGIDKKDLIFDPLAMTVSVDKNSAQVTLTALKRIREELGCHTSLGVSNVSFGLPCRDGINATFFALALENGLSGAIMNPYSAEMMRTYYAFNALKGLDENFAEYLTNAPKLQAVEGKAETVVAVKTDGFSALQEAIVKGFLAQAERATTELLKEKAPMQIVNEEIIPALNFVGENFEKKKVYLPSLLMSAESAKRAFETLKVAMGESQVDDAKTVVLATVEGDVHDIGKNIVKLLLENYGYKVVDLGKDVSPNTVLDAVVKTQAKLVGLSALMTTTVPNMEKTIALLKAETPWAKIVVGGAVLSRDYAEKIGADAYAKDGMETVRYAEKVFS